jgi:hypothetical protein
VETPDRADGKSDAPAWAGADPRAFMRPFSSPGTRVVLGWTALAAVLMVLSAVSDGIAPRGSRANGQNLPGELTRNLAMMTVEAMVLLTILRPWSLRNSWGRVLMAWVIVTPYALLYFAVTMHSGPISTVHAFWLIGFVLVLPVVVVHALVGHFRRRG